MIKNIGKIILLIILLNIVACYKYILVPAEEYIKKQDEVVTELVHSKLELQIYRVYVKGIPYLVSSKGGMIPEVR